MCTPAAHGAASRAPRVGLLGGLGVGTIADLARRSSRTKKPSQMEQLLAMAPSTFRLGERLPNVAGALFRRPNGRGIGSTLLTGPAGVNPLAGTLGGNVLLGG